MNIMAYSGAEILSLLWLGLKIFGLVAVVIFGIYEAKKFRDRLIEKKRNKNIVDFSSNGDEKKEDTN